MGKKKRSRENFIIHEPFDLIGDPIRLLQDELEKLDGLIEAEKRYVKANPDLDIAHAGFCEGKLAAWAQARNDLKEILKKVRDG